LGQNLKKFLKAVLKSKLELNLTKDELEWCRKILICVFIFFEPKLKINWQNFNQFRRLNNSSLLLKYGPKDSIVHINQPVTQMLKLLND